MKKKQKTDRQAFESAFWDGEVGRNIYHSIWADEAVEDDTDADLDEFEASGREEAARLLQYIHPEATVLDLGCGIGRVMRSVAPHCKKVIGVDISSEMIAHAREYLREVDGVQLVHGDGVSLKGVSDDQVDFLYSLLCLIHVNKRSAYQYLCETKRVLRPGGLAFLQFQNMLTPEGLARFQESVGTDYPYEFYTPEELRVLLDSVGLTILTEVLDREFINLCVLNGNPAERTKAWTSTSRVDDLTGSSLALDEEDPSRVSGEIHMKLVNQSDEWRTVTLTISLVAGVEEGQRIVTHAHAVAPLPPRTTAPLRMIPRGAGGSTSMLLGERELDVSETRQDMPVSHAWLDLHCAVIPSGFLWNAETRALFPDWFGAIRLSR